MIKGVILDLDGVIISTDMYHYEAWKRLADEQGIYFDKKINMRLRGVSRMESLNILLERAVREYTQDDKQELAEKKNRYYRDYIKDISEENILPGVLKFIEELKSKGIKVAIGSSSKNSKQILKNAGIEDFFDATVDGNDIKNSKPDPEVFLLAAQRIGINPSECLVVEDADAGVDAALAAGMKVLAVGVASKNKKANAAAKSLEKLSVDRLLSKFKQQLRKSDQFIKIFKP